jgi:hypothetical protein
MSPPILHTPTSEKPRPRPKPKPPLRGLTVGILVAVAVGVLAAAALAASPSITFVSPSPAEAATLTTNSASYAFTYNRTPKQTASLTCSLSGPTSSSGPCNLPLAAGKQQSSSGASYKNLANGNYTFTVSLTLTDGGTATAVRHFTVTVDPCTAGSENFSKDAEHSQPTTFSGGTIDTAYGTGGGVYGPLGGFSGNSLTSGDGMNSTQLTYTNAVGSVQLDAESDHYGGVDTTLTLTGYNAANAVVDSDSAFQRADTPHVTHSLSISSPSNNIKYFTIATNDPLVEGVFFSNIVWTCN